MRISGIHILFNAISVRNEPLSLVAPYCRLANPACCSTWMPRQRPWPRGCWSAARRAAAPTTTRKPSRSAWTFTTKPLNPSSPSTRAAASSGRWVRPWAGCQGFIIPCFFSLTFIFCRHRSDFAFCGSAAGGLWAAGGGGLQPSLQSHWRLVVKQQTWMCWSGFCCCFNLF